MLLLVALTLCGCSSSKYALPYTADSKISSFRIVESEGSTERVSSFASKLCVADSDVSNSEVSLTTEYVGAGLFDISSGNVICSQNIHEHFNPASLTKIMTAIVALKNGSMDMVLTASSNVDDLESGAQAIGLESGDTMTLAQALNILLIYSANDVAILIAEGIGGSVDNFVNMMNEEAINIGATNSNFVNPHGLTAEDHYTTPYDLYLMMNTAMQYDMFNEIIHTTEYSTEYHDASGNSKAVSLKSTNLYLTGDKSVPSGVTIVGGKTGTTNAAGHCLILLSRDTKSNPFISVILKADNRDDLYSNMTSLLSQIN